MQVFRFQTLVSLLFSSQTRDQDTAAAVRNLQNHWTGGLTVANVRKATEEEIDQQIRRVGFHQKKAK